MIRAARATLYVLISIAASNSSAAAQVSDGGAADIMLHQAPAVGRETTGQITLSNLPAGADYSVVLYASEGIEARLAVSSGRVAYDGRAVVELTLTVTKTGYHWVGLRVEGNEFSPFAVEYDIASSQDRGVISRDLSVRRFDREREILSAAGIDVRRAFMNQGPVDAGYRYLEQGASLPELDRAVHLAMAASDSLPFTTAEDLLQRARRSIDAPTDGRPQPTSPSVSSSQCPAGQVYLAGQITYFDLDEGVRRPLPGVFLKISMFDPATGDDDLSYVSYYVNEQGYFGPYCTELLHDGTANVAVYTKNRYVGIRTKGADPMNAFPGMWLNRHYLANTSFLPIEVTDNEVAHILRVYEEAVPVMHSTFGYTRPFIWAQFAPDEGDTDWYCPSWWPCGLQGFDEMIFLHGRTASPHQEYVWGPRGEHAMVHEYGHAYGNHLVGGDFIGHLPDATVGCLFHSFHQEDNPSCALSEGFADFVSWASRRPHNGFFHYPGPEIRGGGNTSPLTAAGVAFYLYDLLDANNFPLTRPSAIPLDDDGVSVPGQYLVDVLRRDPESIIGAIAYYENVGPPIQYPEFQPYGGAWPHLPSGAPSPPVGFTAARSAQVWRLNFFGVTPKPDVRSVSPNAVPLGSTTRVALDGFYFNTQFPPTVVVSGSGVSVSNVSVPNNQHLEFDLSVAPTATAGLRSIVVDHAGNADSTFTGAIEILAPYAVSAGAPDLVTVKTTYPLTGGANYPSTGWRWDELYNSTYTLWAQGQSSSFIAYAGIYAMDWRLTATRSADGNTGAGYAQTWICIPYSYASCPGSPEVAPPVATVASSPSNPHDGGPHHFGSGLWVEPHGRPARQGYSLANATRLDAVNLFESTEALHVVVGDARVDVVPAPPRAEVRTYSVSVTSRQQVRTGFAVDPDLGVDPADDQMEVFEATGEIVVSDGDYAIGYFFTSEGSQLPIRVRQYSTDPAVGWYPDPTDDVAAATELRSSRSRLISGAHDVRFLAFPTGRPRGYEVSVVRGPSAAHVRAAMASMETGRRAEQGAIPPTFEVRATVSGALATSLPSGVSMSRMDGAAAALSPAEIRTAVRDHGIRAMHVGIPRAAIGETMTVRIYDTQGGLVETMTFPAVEAGYFQIDWDGTDSTGRKAPRGVYTVRATLGQETQTSRFVLVR